MEGLFGRIPEEAPDESPASTPPPSPARDAQAAPPAEQGASSRVLESRPYHPRADGTPGDG